MTFSGYNAVNLDLLYIIAILLGILVIISKNPIVSVLFLIGLFLCISAYLILTGLNLDRKSTRLNSSHSGESRMPSSA